MEQEKVYLTGIAARHKAITTVTPAGAPEKAPLRGDSNLHTSRPSRVGEKTPLCARAFMVAIG